MSKSKEQEANRRLSRAEQARKEAFEKTEQLLLSQGYHKEDLTIGLAFANLMALAIGLPLIFLLAFGFIMNNSLNAAGIPLSAFAIIFIVLIVLIAIHELIHGLCWSIFAKNHLQSISFGFLAKYLTPYCSCNEALTRSQYVFGVFMPTLLLGFLPGIFSIITGSGALFYLSALMILTGCGDLTILLKIFLFRGHTKDALYMDHPYQAGCVVFLR